MGSSYEPPAPPPGPPDAFGRQRAPSSTRRRRLCRARRAAPPSELPWTLPRRGGVGSSETDERRAGGVSGRRAVSRARPSRRGRWPDPRPRRERRERHRCPRRTPRKVRCAGGRRSRNVIDVVKARRLADWSRRFCDQIFYPYEATGPREARRYAATARLSSHRRVLRHLVRDEHDPTRRARARGPWCPPAKSAPNPCRATVGARRRGRRFSVPPARERLRVCRRRSRVVRRSFQAPDGLDIPREVQQTRASRSARAPRPRPAAR